LILYRTLHHESSPLAICVRPPAAGTVSGDALAVTAMSVFDLFSQKEHFISLSNCGLIVGADQSVFLRIIVERIGRSWISFILQFEEEFHKSLPLIPENPTLIPRLSGPVYNGWLIHFPFFQGSGADALRRGLHWHNACPNLHHTRSRRS